MCAIINTDERTIRITPIPTLQVFDNADLCFIGGIGHILPYSCFALPIPILHFFYSDVCTLFCWICVNIMYLTCNDMIILHFMTIKSIIQSNFLAAAKFNDCLLKTCPKKGVSDNGHLNAIGHE